MAAHKDWGHLTEQYHQANPDIYSELVRLAKQAKEEKHMRSVGIALLIEILRWEKGIGVNQNFAAHYARKIMQQEPGFEGFFNLRKRNWQRDLEELEAACTQQTTTES